MSDRLAVHLAARTGVIDDLRRELLGPDPRGTALAMGQGPAKAAGPPPFQTPAGEEILLRDSPRSRYLLGVLHPVGTPADVNSEVDEAKENGKAADPDAPPDEPIGIEPEDAAQAVEGELTEKLGRGRRGREQGGDDFDLSSAHQLQPASMGVSFLAALPPGSSLILRISGGRYAPAVDIRYPTSAETNARQRTDRAYVRHAVLLDSTIGSMDLADAAAKGIPVKGALEDGPLRLEFQTLVRPREADGGFLVTVALMNRTTEAKQASSELLLFQSELRVEVLPPDNGAEDAAVLPYPGPPVEHLDEEELSLALLYDRIRPFATGHGCAADWELNDEGVCRTVIGTHFPVVEIPSTTPEIVAANGSPLEVPIDAQAGLADGQAPNDIDFGALEAVVGAYEAWVETQAESIPTLHPDHHPTAEEHLARCRVAAGRMWTGIELLRERQGDVVGTAYRLANAAILWQQVRNRGPSRLWLPQENRIEGVLDPEELPPTAARGRWRPFQIAFLLINLESLVDPKSQYRKHVELLWFPTGGGKTEAYLGLAAFAIFLRRLRALEKGRMGENAGIEVMSRYTLRLLQSQQFQRTAALICAMEFLRQTRGDLGRVPFQLGTYSGVTPNSRTRAREALDAEAGGNVNDEGHGQLQSKRSVRVLDRCPWCRAEMGIPSGAGANAHLLGFVRDQNTVRARCPDPRCRFGDIFHDHLTRLPLVLIDEDLYDRGMEPVSMVIGTIDKLAMLAWKPEARILFGRDDDGVAVTDPPGLLIQDELHLISGPLGSIAGLYEMAIEKLCTRPDGVLPKIIASTATIRRAPEQTRALYGRADLQLFPPAGLEAGDSFFAQYAREPDGRLRPGRIHVGVMSPGSSQTAQVRTFASLHQAAGVLDTASGDPFWTHLIFYNSIRELGGGMSLFQSDIQDQRDVLRRRWNVRWAEMRKLRLSEVKELTSRLKDSEINPMLARLGTRNAPYPAPAAVDACLASSIIEVGVDVERLSLMTVVGQPKTTSQYIQVTGRVGRNWWETPGLVITILSAGKARDRSHLEQFRGYHQQLYAQVEPTSVTPFSPPVLSRALHAVAALWIRQTKTRNGVGANPHHVDDDIFRELRRMLIRRVARVDKEEHKRTGDAFNALKNFWVSRKKVGGLQNWGHINKAPIAGDLLRWPGIRAEDELMDNTKLAPSSMRDVGLDCEIGISTPWRERRNPND